jgi:hypothetical protein
MYGENSLFFLFVVTAICSPMWGFMLLFLLKVKLLATDEYCDSTSKNYIFLTRQAAGTAFVLAREGTASQCDKFLLPVF